MQTRLLIVAAVVLASWSCKGRGGSSSNTTPTTPTPSTGNAMVVTIAGERNNQSFSPNPVPVTQGNLVAWRNADAIVHRIVTNDGSFDSGDLAPGATSSAMRLSNAGGNYHCSIHPATMFGSINVATTPPDAGGNPPGY